MPINNNSVAVVTGAASGIGRALAIRLAGEGVAGIAISDVNEAGLQETVEMAARPGIAVSQHLVDVSKLDDIERFEREVIDRHGRITHLINNAGVALVGEFEHLSIKDFEWLMGINFWGVVYGCKAFLPHLLKEPDAHVVNVSSLFGLVAPEGQTAYCASKFAVRGFTESLRHELEDTNVSVTSVHPGGVRTNIVRNSRVGESAPDEWKTEGTELFEMIARTTPEDAAGQILMRINRKIPFLLIGRDARWTSQIADVSGR